MNAATVRRIDPGRGAAAMPPGNAPEVDAATVLPFHTLPFHTGIRGNRAAPAGAARSPCPRVLRAPRTGVA